MTPTWRDFLASSAWSQHRLVHEYKRTYERPDQRRIDADFHRLWLELQGIPGGAVAVAP